MNVVHVVATEERGGLERFLDSAARAGLQVQILGANQQWQGWRWRMQLYQTAARDAFQRGEPYILFCDAYDILCHPLAKEKLAAILDRFDKEESTHFLFGAESWCQMNCIPISQWWNSQPDSKTKLRHINAGCFLGKSQHVVSMFEWILKQDPMIWDDQIGVGFFANSETGQKHVKLDLEQQLVTNVVGLDHFNPFLDPDSAFVHFPSPVTKTAFSFAYNALARKWTSYPNPVFFFGYRPRQVKEIQFYLTRFAVFLLVLSILYCYFSLGTNLKGSAESFSSAF